MAKVSKRLRYEILRRDGFKCRYCGTVAAATELRVDHVIPDSLGGLSEPSNLVTACDPCNSGKSSVPPEAPVVAQVAEDALRWSAAMQQAAADMEAKLKKRDDQNAVFLDEWNGYSYDGGKHLPLDPTWATTLVRLRTAGLTDPLIVEAVAATMAAGKVLPGNRFRYFCGVAWNMITKLQAAAEKLASDEVDAQEDELTAGRSRADLADDLDLFRAVIEKFTEAVPEWLDAEGRAMLASYIKETDKPDDVSFSTRQALYLLYVTLALENCQIQKNAEGGE
jgi:hypothetical protein